MTTGAITITEKSQRLFDLVSFCELMKDRLFHAAVQNDEAIREILSDLRDKADALEAKLDPKGDKP